MDVLFALLFGLVIGAGLMYWVPRQLKRKVSRVDTIEERLSKLEKKK